MVGSSEMPLELREFDRGGDYGQYRDLFLLSFPETKSTPVSTDPHYQWKLGSVPATPASYEFAAVHDGRVVGYYAALPYRYVIEGAERLCGMVCDVMTHPDMRGQGIFTKIGRFSTEALGSKGIDFVSGYPIRPEVIPGHLKVGWFVAFQEPLYVRPLKAGALLRDKAWARPLVPLVDRCLDACNLVARFGRSADHRVDVMSRDEFLRDPGYDAFLSQWAAEQRNYLVKNRAFLAWRTGAPGAAYRFLKLSVRGEWAGLAIARSTELRGVPALAVLDFMVVREHARGAKSLHDALRALAIEDGREVVATMMSRALASRYGLARSLYLKTPAVFSVIFKLLNPELQREGFGAEADWHLMWIDSDDL